MKKRRLKLLSLVLAAGMTVPSIAPAVPVAAANQEESREGAQEVEKVDRQRKKHFGGWRLSTIQQKAPAEM